MKFLLPFLLSCSVAFGSTFYVDFSAGNDAADGLSVSTPWRTIPGTRTLDGAAYLNASWGAITTANRLQPGSIVRLKSGTSHTSSSGGYVWITSTAGAFYSDTALGYGQFLFQRDTNWGSGPVTFNAAGMTNDVAVILSTVDGVTFDGNGTNGIVIANGNYDGIQVKEKPGSSAKVSYTHIKDILCQTNALAVATDADGAGIGAIAIRRGDHILIEGCTVDGGQQYSEGVLLGESNWEATDATVRNCEAFALKGDPLGTDDAGIGFKSYNAQCQWENLYSHNNQKGFDVGQEGGTSTSLNITNIIFNSTICSNYTGINSPGTSQKPYTGTIAFYLINSLVYSNAYQGLRTYGGPHQGYVIHCVFDNNGSAPPDGTYAGHIRYSANDFIETDPMVLRVYNTSFRRAYEMTYLVFNYRATTNNLTFDLDYDSYEQQAAEAFFKWSVNTGSDPYYGFSYGANGPGHSSGRYYTTYDGTLLTVPVAGTGHYHCDPHSKGTGCDDTSLPVFDSTYHLTGAFPGVNLSDKAWYLPQMGVDRSGANRATWDLGPYDFTGYYVATNGSDANPGTASSPWLTIQHAADTVVAGDRVHIGPGTFNEFVTNTVSGTPGNSITFTGAANWTTIIDPSTALTNGWVLDASMSNGVYSNTAPWQVAEMELDSKQVMFVYSTGNIAAALQSAWPTIALTTGAQLLSAASNFSVTPYYNNVPVPFWDGVEALWSSASDHTVWLRLRDGSDPNGRNIRVSPNGSPAGGLRSEELLAPAIYIGASNIVWQNVLVRGARGQILLDGTAANNVVIRSNYLSGGVQRILAQNGCWSNTIVGNVFSSDFYGGTNIGAWSGQNSAVYGRRESAFYQLPKYCMGNSGSLGYDAHGKYIGNGNVILGNTLLPGLVGIEIEGDVAAPTFYLTIASNYISSHASLAVALHDGVTQASVFENTMIDNNLSIREHDMGQTDETNRVHLIYRNRSWQPAAGEHVYFYWIGQIPGGNYHPEIWIYNNSFAGGIYAVDLGIELDWNDGGARNVRIVNNIADENFIYTYNPFKTNSTALKADYNLKLVEPFYNGAYEGSHTLTNNATEWPAGIIPNWSLRSGSLARNTALDVTAPFILQGTSFAALPLTGTKSGPAWDIGAVESGGVFRVTNLRIVNLNQ